MPAKPAPATAPNGKRLSPDARRRQIVATAQKLIAENGFNAVSLADIAGACGIAKSLVLHYFPSVAHLLAAVLKALDEKAYIDTAGDSDLPRDAASSRLYVTKFVKHAFSQRQLIRLYHVLEAESLSPTHGAHAYFQNRVQLIQRFHAEVLHWKPCPATAAIQMNAFWNGLERLWLRDETIDVMHIWENFCDSFFV